MLTSALTNKAAANDVTADEAGVVVVVAADGDGAGVIRVHGTTRGRRCLAWDRRGEAVKTHGRSSRGTVRTRVVANQAMVQLPVPRRRVLPTKALRHQLTPICRCVSNPESHIVQRTNIELFSLGENPPICVLLFVASVNHTFNVAKRCPLSRV